MRTKEFVIALLTAWLLAIVLTWPIAPRLGTAGRLDSGDGRYSTWNVAWVAHALTTDPRQLYNANIFYPHEKTLAYSEANLVAGVLAIPVWLLTKNAVAATNWVILCAFVLSALATYVLVRRLTASRAGAALAAVAFAFCPFVFSHIPHVQLLMTFVLPLSLLAMHRFVEAPSVRRSIGLGGALALQGLACGYYGVFGGLAVGFGVLWFAIALGRWRDWRYWSLALVAAAVMLVLISPFLVPYLELQSAGFERALDEARLYSVRWRSYLASDKLLHQWMLPLIGTWREVLFPGFLALGFGAVAVMRGFSRRTTSFPVRRAILGFYLALAGLAVWASLGPDAGLYALLYNTVPLFSLLRAPARIGLLVTLSVAILAGIGFASIERSATNRRRRWLFAIVAPAALALATVGPLELTDAAPVHPAKRRLAALPWGVVAEFPFFASSSERHRHTEYMVLSTRHWKPLINGYSDYTPGEVVRDLPKLAAFPELQAWSVLRDHQARYVVVHWASYEPEERQRVAVSTRDMAEFLRPIFGDSQMSLFEIVGWPGGS